ncbi:MAG TPA: glycine cleavage system protein H [Chlamydiales bacterium]|nr:glycine cleavage system protein H [Chlamydiales bacterium]
MRHYTETQEWVEIHDTVATVGVSTSGAKEIGTPTYIEFPEIGAELEEGDIAAVVESTKAAIDISTPVSGTVIEINEALQKNPKLFTESPEKDGWLIRLKVSAERRAQNAEL